MYETRWAIIGRGLAGWHAQSFDGTRGDGGRLEDYTYWTGQACKGYLSNALEGAVVYDASAADAAAFTMLVLRGPIVHANLYGVRKFGRSERQAAAAMLPGMSGGFDTMTAIALAQPEEQLGAFDYCDWATYRRLLEKLGNVRFGSVRGGQVVWEADQ